MALLSLVKLWSDPARMAGIAIPPRDLLLSCVYLPTVRLYLPWVSGHVTLIDLLSDTLNVSVTHSLSRTGKSNFSAHVRLLVKPSFLTWPWRADSMRRSM